MDIGMQNFRETPWVVTHAGIKSCDSVLVISANSKRDISNGNFRKCDY
jgi:hypothetical protein